MSITRKLRREKEIQERRALRVQLKDESVRNFINQQVSMRLQQSFVAGIKAGKQGVANAAQGLSYDG